MNSSKAPKDIKKDNQKGDKKINKKPKKLSPEEAKIQSQIDQNSEQIKKHSASIFNLNKELNDLDRQTKKFLEYMSENAKKMEQKQNDLNNLKSGSSGDNSFAQNKRKAEDEVNKIKNQIIDLIGDVKRWDEESLYDAFASKIERLDKDVESGNISSREEKIAISKISALKANKILIIKYSDASKELNKYKVDPSIKSKRSDEFNRSNLISTIDYLMENQHKLYERLQHNSEEFSKKIASIKKYKLRLLNLLKLIMNCVAK